MTKHSILTCLLLGLSFTFLIYGAFYRPTKAVHASPAPVSYDISQWQGYLSDNEASHLKSEVPFIIVRGTYGDTTDSQSQHNISELSSHQIPYGVYNYSSYTDPDSAEQDADKLYRTAPHAKFYVNDAEINQAGPAFNDSTVAWANEMHRLTRRPVILYSNLSFMNDQVTPQTRQTYNTLWLADYSSEPDPDYHYDLWQYTDHQYSPALNQYIDASALPDGAKPLSYWIHGKQHSAPIHIIDHKTQKLIERAGHLADKLRHARPHVSHKQAKHLSLRKLDKMNYYYSPKIHDLVVTRHGGINLYYRHHAVHHVAEYHVIPVKFFNLHKGKTYWSRGVTEYHHHEANFTASKNDVDIMVML